MSAKPAEDPSLTALPPLDPSAHVTAEQMKHVLDVTRMLLVTSDLEVLFRRMAESTTALLQCERASIFLHDPKTSELWTRVALQSAGIRLPSHLGIVGHAFTTNQVLNIPDPYADPRFNPQPDRTTGFLTRSILAVPMVDWSRNPVGVMQAINKHGGPFRDGDVALLQLLADQVGVAIQRYHLQQAAVRSTELRKEMELARQVQEAMLPRGAVDLPDGSLHARGFTRPASINGGDTFDLWQLADGRLGVLVADASGHGIGPALVVSQVRALVRTLSDVDADPARVLTRVNGRLAQDLDRGRFCTVFLGYIDLAGTVEWCSGGHGPILLREPGGKATHVIDATMPPLGILDPFPGTPPAPLRIEPGGCLIVPTDGITESCAPDGKMLGIEGVLESLSANPNASAEDLIEQLHQTLKHWQQDREPEDDQTAVVVRRAP